MLTFSSPLRSLVNDRHLLYRERLAFFLASQVTRARDCRRSGATAALFPPAHEDRVFLPLFFRFFFPLCASPHAHARLRLMAPLLYALFAQGLRTNLVPSESAWEAACVALSGDTPNSRTVSAT